MNRKNLIRIDDLDQPAFRIFACDRVEQLFSDKMLVLVRPEMWDDPFENFLLKCTVLDTTDGTTSSLSSLANSWYGSCWTLQSDSDAMWRIYSPRKDGIRVKTTIRKLAEAIWDPKDSFSSLKYFIGKVQYRSRTEIENFLRKATFWGIALGGQNTGFAETLLIKRTEFDHEKEIRILAYCIDESKDPRVYRNLYKIPIEPNNFIDELCIDPRLSDTEANDVRNKLLSFGYKGPICQSELYKLKMIQIKSI